MIAILQKLSNLQKGILIACLVLGAFIFFYITSEKKQALSQLEIKKMLENEGVSFQKQKEPKGFELFDSNTWLKGEKELQVLEIRALKGQLERDLRNFEAIENAHVILDIAPVNALRPSQLKTKASVILSVKEGKVITSSMVVAICDYIAGGVKGLEPHMVAISDTTGRVYKSFNGELPEVLDIVETPPKQEVTIIKSPSHPFQKKWFFLLFIPLCFLPYHLWKKNKWKKVMKERSKNLGKEKAETIAHLLTYFSPEHAEKILGTLSETKQEEVLLHLSEIEE